MIKEDADLKSEADSFPEAFPLNFKDYIIIWLNIIKQHNHPGSLRDVQLENCEKRF